MTNNEARLKKILKKNFNVKPNSVSKTTTFIVDLDMDSLDIIEFIMSVEDEFKIELSDAEVEKIVNFEDALCLIEKTININSHDE